MLTPISSPRIDVWADLRNALPFRDNTVDVFYSHHMIEHLPDAILPFHFKEMFRCLKPGGFIRVGGPHGDNACRMYVAGNSAWFSDFPDQRTSLGGRLANHILCRGEHLTILTPSYLEEIGARVGFVNLRTCVPTRETFHPEMIDQMVLSKEFEDNFEVPHTLIIEMEKPANAGGAH